MKWLCEEVVDLLDVIRCSTYRHVWWFELEIGQVTFDSIGVVDQMCLVRLMTCKTNISHDNEKPIILNHILNDDIQKDKQMNLADWAVFPDKVVATITEIINELSEYDTHVNDDTVRIELNRDVLFSLMAYKNTNN